MSITSFMITQYFWYDNKLKSQFGNNIITIVHIKDISFILCSCDVFHTFNTSIKNLAPIQFYEFKGIIYNYILFNKEMINTFYKNLTHYIPIDIVVDDAYNWIVQKQMKTHDKDINILFDIRESAKIIPVIVEEPKPTIKKVSSREDFIPSPHVDKIETPKDLDLLVVEVNNTSGVCKTDVIDDIYVYVTLDEADI